MKTKTKKIYEVETANDTSMVIQPVIPTAGGRKLAPEIAFTLTDEVSEDWAVTVTTCINKAEARQLIKLLIDLTRD